jgi:hypothetical protein
MRTKTLLVTAALSVASIAAAMAQTVYSVNAVGYVKIGPIPANGFFLAANPLSLPDNSIALVLPDVPNNTVIYKLTGGTFASYTKRPTGWTADTKLEPGEGFFIQNKTTSELTITFVGEVLQGTQTVNYPAGFSILGSKIPQAGKLETDLGFSAAVGDTVYQLIGGTYASAKARAGANKWPAGEPVIDVGNGFFYQAAAAGTWSRTFNVNQ